MIVGEKCGLASCIDAFERRISIPFREIPHFPTPSVPGHPGNLVFGSAEGIPVVALQGRLHLYEGYSAAEVAYPVRIIGCLGIKQLVITNAAGAVNPAFRPGDLMLITDHINLTGTNPLIGENLDALGPRFPDMSTAYDKGLRKIAREAAREQGIELRSGIYAGVCGPCYETPAEVRMCRILGADAVGMSTVQEVIVARHMGIPVLGIACITNMAAGILKQKLAHREVIESMAKIKPKLFSLIRTILPRLAKRPHERAAS